MDGVFGSGEYCPLIRLTLVFRSVSWDQAPRLPALPISGSLLASTSAEVILAGLAIIEIAIAAPWRWTCLDYALFPTHAKHHLERSLYLVGIFSGCSCFH